MSDTANQTTRRKKIEDHILTYMKLADRSGYNHTFYKDMFEKMPDESFWTWHQEIKEGKRRLEMYAPNMKINLRVEDLKRAAAYLQVPLFEKLRIFDTKTSRYYYTPHEYFITILPVRRQKQHLPDKISVPESDKRVDLFTGQVIKPDKGSSMSTVEAQTLMSKGLTYGMYEFMTIRGGNIPAYASFKAQLEETGHASIDEIDTSGTVRSLAVSAAYLRAMLIDNNIVPEA